jgi:hypothetical protein
MSSTKIRKRRIINFKKPASARKNCSFQEHVDQMHRDWHALMNSSDLAKDPRFLRKMAINIMHLHHIAKKKGNSGNGHLIAKQIADFFSMPLDAPIAEKESLVHAAYLFGEQEPIESDLSRILHQFTVHSHQNPVQLLSQFRELSSRACP